MTWELWSVMFQNQSSRYPFELPQITGTHPPRSTPCINPSTATTSPWVVARFVRGCFGFGDHGVQLLASMGVWFLVNDIRQRCEIDTLLELSDSLNRESGNQLQFSWIFLVSSCTHFWVYITSTICIMPYWLHLIWQWCCTLSTLIRASVEWYMLPLALNLKLKTLLRFNMVQVSRHHPAGKGTASNRYDLYQLSWNVYSKMHLCKLHVSVF